VRRRRRWAVSPDLDDETLDRNGLVSAEQEPREDGTLLAAPELERAPAGLGLERAEDAELG
jgi:hypothetical protein